MTIEFKDVIVIGGVNRWGAGRYVSDIVSALQQLGISVEVVSTNGMRLLDLARCLRLIVYRGSQDVIVFQPSIAGWSFLRDLAIWLCLRVYAVRFRIIVVSQLRYRNYFLRSKCIKDLLFTRASVIACAQLPELFGTKTRVSVVPPLVSLAGETTMGGGDYTVGDASRCFVHVGYLDKLKGFDAFVRLAERLPREEYLAIGGVITQGSGLVGYARELENLGLYEIESREGLFAAMRAVAHKYRRPWLIYSSRFDLAPLTIYEAAVLGFVPVVETGTNSAEIMRNFLPAECFFEIAEIGEFIESESQDDFDGRLSSLRKHVALNNELFQERILASLLQEETA
ncbi:MAG: hypothetical protein AAGG55_05675 [Pseudomonadota bacterium]